ncbi:hypothetical protein PMAYCL1PPCAC_18916, partial [Pristionchus mayeri]
VFSKALPVVATFNSIAFSLSSITVIWVIDITSLFPDLCLLLWFHGLFTDFPHDANDAGESVTDARRRASAIALQRLLINLIAIPAPQIIGTIADAFKGNSDLDKDTFKSYQKALAVNWLSLLLCSFFLFTSIFFYSDDAKNVRGPLRPVVKGEKDPLLGRRTSRTASVLETSLMGRRATMESVRR